MSPALRSLRFDVNCPASVICNDGLEFSCTIRNISLNGACIEYNKRHWLPDEFTLHSDELALDTPAWRMWRIGSKVGIRFLTPILIGSV